MLSVHSFDLAGLVSLQRFLSDISIWQLVATVLAVITIGIAVDYARILLLRAKMVRQHKISSHLPRY